MHLGAKQDMLFVEKAVCIPVQGCLIQRRMTMFKRILVPLDGSARAERALAVASRLAQASGGSLILLQVVGHDHDLWISGLPPRTQVDTPFAPELMQAERYLAQVTISPALKTIPTETVVLGGS